MKLSLVILKYSKMCDMQEQRFVIHHIFKIISILHLTYIFGVPSNHMARPYHLIFHFMSWPVSPPHSLFLHRHHHHDYVMCIYNLKTNKTSRLTFSCLCLNSLLIIVLCKLSFLISLCFMNSQELVLGAAVGWNSVI
jgi:hypothetical protein